MSRSPQNGGFHKCTGGSPFPAALAVAAWLAAAVSPSSPASPVCPWFAMVCPDSQRLHLARWVQASFVFRTSFSGESQGSTRHIVMPFIPRNADNVGTSLIQRIHGVCLSLAWVNDAIGGVSDEGTDHGEELDGWRRQCRKTGGRDCPIRRTGGRSNPGGQRRHLHRHLWSGTGD